MLKSIKTDDFETYVQVAYAFDTPLIEKWHVIAGSGLQDCVKRTVQDLENCVTLRFFCVYDNEEEFVGYFGTEFDGAYMPTIYIMPDYRGMKNEFWKLIEAEVQPVWQAGIYSKNTPCMRFYAKKGIEVGRLPTPSGEVAVFKFERSSTCQPAAQ